MSDVSVKGGGSSSSVSGCLEFDSSITSGSSSSVSESDDSDASANGGGSSSLSGSFPSRQRRALARFDLAVRSHFATQDILG